MQECNLTMKDYVFKHKWIGTGNANCTDPIALRNHISTRMDEFGISGIVIQTFDQKWHDMYLNDSSLHWSTYYEPYRVCYTMMLPEMLVKLGIFKIQIKFNNTSYLQVYLHQKGLLYTDMPDSYVEVPWKANRKTVDVGHEIVELLEYNEEICQNDIDYQLDQCRLKYIQKVFF